MTDHSDLIAELRALADYDSRAGEPLGKCMRRAASALTSQSLSLSQAREEADHQRKCAVEWHDRMLAAERQRDKALEAVEGAKSVLREAAKHTTGPLYLSITEGLTSLRDATWSIRSALENGPAGLADATNDPASSDPSSLRKGAEVANKAEAILRQVRRFIAAEHKHARLTEQGKNTTRDDVDFEHSLVTSFTVADVDAALRMVSRRRAALVSGCREDGE